jgi:hypothetical protein
VSRERKRSDLTSPELLLAFRTDIITSRAMQFCRGLPGPALTSVKLTDISFGPLAYREIPDAFNLDQRPVPLAALLSRCQRGDKAGCPASRLE